MSKTKAWIGAMRLRTLPLSLSGIILGSAVAHFNGNFNVTSFSLAIVTTVLFQILSNFANDLGDSSKGTDNDNRIGPTRAIQSGIISSKEMKIAVVLTSVLSLLSAIALIYNASQTLSIATIWFYAALTLACIAAAIMYTVGKSAYGYHGFGDLMVFIFFGGVSILGVYSLYAPVFLPENILLVFFVGLMSVAVLNLNNMRDYFNDKASGKNTIVVQIGPNLAKFYHILLILIALMSLALFIEKTDKPLLFFALTPTILLFIHLRKVLGVKELKEFDPELKKVALLTFFISLLTSIGLFYL
tara:strand:+ start:261 stop:1163 length:903 start_codon:yes stop_codon:yes gene_type:complete